LAGEAKSLSGGSTRNGSIVMTSCDGSCLAASATWRLKSARIR